MRWALLALGALLVAVAAGVAVSQRHSIAERLLLDEIRRAGIDEASLVVEAVGVGSLSLSDVRLGAPPALEIARIDVRYSPGNLRVGYLDELQMSGLQLRASYDDDGLSLGALDVLWRGSGQGGDGGAGALPARSIAITDARVDLEAPFGAVSPTFEIGVEDLGDGSFEAEGDFEIRHSMAEASGGVTAAGTLDRFEGTLEVQGSPLSVPDLRLGGPLRANAEFQLRDGAIEASASLQPVPVEYRSELLRVEGKTPEVELGIGRAEARAPFEFALETRGGRLDLPDNELSAKELSVSARLVEDGVQGDLRIGRLGSRHRPPLVEPLELRGSFGIRNSSAGYRLTLANARGSFALDAKGSADLTSRSARADLHLRPIAFEEGGLQPVALFPFLEDQVEAASGSVEVAGTASWDGARAAAEIDVALREVGFTARGATVRGLNGRIEIAGPSPPVTKPGQLVSIALIDIGLELTNGLIAFQLRPDGLIHLERAEWQWAGGAVRTAGLLDPMADFQQLALEVDGVDLAELLTLVNLDGLEGSGRLGGRVPIFRSGETLEIRGGELAGAPGGGRIRYRPSDGAEAMAEQGEGLDQLLGALEDFHYDFLRLSVDGDTRGDVDVMAQLGGFNPNFERGQRVEFNLNVEARLADLLSAGLAANRVPEAIQKRLEAFEVPEVQ